MDGSSNLQAELGSCVHEQRTRVPSGPTVATHSVHDRFHDRRGVRAGDSYGDGALAIGRRAAPSDLRVLATVTVLASTTNA